MEDRITGSVKWWNSTRGYGFITQPNGPDIFVLFTSLKMNGPKDLVEGQLVEFSIEKGPKGLQAINVIPISEKPKQEAKPAIKQDFQSFFSEIQGKDEKSISAGKKINQYEFSNMLNKLSKEPRYKESIDLIGEEPNNYKGYLSLGTSLEKDKEYLTAIKVFRQCIQIDTVVVFALIRMGVCYFNLGDLHKAYLSISSAWMLFHFEEKSMIASAYGEEKSAYPFFNLVDLLVSDYLPTPSTIPSNGKFSDTFYSVGCKCIDNGYLDGAIVCFELTIQDDPLHYKGYSNLGTCLMKVGKFAEGIRPLLKALEISPNDEISYYGLSSAFLIMDYPDFALPCAKRALEIRPNYENVKNILPLIEGMYKIIHQKSNANQLYGSARITGLAQSPQAFKDLRETYNMYAGSNDTRNSDIVRALGAALETELRDFVLPHLNVNSNEQTNSNQFQKELTLGALAYRIGDGYYDLLQNAHHPASQKTDSTLRDKLRLNYHTTYEELSRLANNIGTVSVLRNKAAHGESITTNEAEKCMLHVQTSLEHLMRLRLNFILGKHGDYIIKIISSLNGHDTRLI